MARAVGFVGRARSSAPARAAAQRAASALLALALGALPVAAAEAETDVEAAARGAAAIAPFRAQLQAALQEGLAGGVENAIAVCRDRAPALAVEAAAPGVALGRTSHRLRNPANAPRAWVDPLLARAVAEAASARPAVVRLADGRVGYVEPIFVQPPCLACHGETIAPPIAARLRALYPEDRAVGFRAGDFRGLFWAELPPAD